MADQITFEVTLNTDELEFEIKVKDKPTWTHTTTWKCEVVPATFDLQLHKELNTIKKLQKTFDDSLHVTLTSIRNRKQCLLFSFGHDTLDDAVQMATKYVEVKETILNFIQEIDPKVTDISLRCRVGEQHESSEQGNMNTDERSVKSESVLFSAPVENKKYEAETDWFCKLDEQPVMNLTFISRAFSRLKIKMENNFVCTVHRIRQGSLIIECKHESREDGLAMMINYVKVKDAILECLHEIDPHVNAIKVEVEYREESHEERDPLLEPGHPDKRDVEKPEHDQVVHNLQQQVSYLMKQLQEKKEMEQQQLSDTRMSLWMRPDSPQPSESTGIFTATDTITDVGEELFQTTEDLSEDEGTHRHKGGVSEPGQKSESVIHLTRQLADLKQELKATTDRMHRLETTHKKAPDTDTGREPGSRDTPQGSDQPGGGSSHPSEMEALRPGATQESELPATSREEETRKSGTPLEPDTRATPTPARRDPEADRDLLDASREGNMAAVKRILAAVYNGHRDVVELLVSEGADVSRVDGDGNNILHYACFGGDVETVKCVLSMNVVDIDARNNAGQTAADVARRRGHQEVVKLLSPPRCHVM